MNISRENFTDLGILKIVSSVDNLIKIEYKTFENEILPDFLIYSLNVAGVYREGKIILPKKNRPSKFYELTNFHKIYEGEEPDLIDFGLRNEKQIIKINNPSLLENVAEIHTAIFLYNTKNKEIVFDKIRKKEMYNKLFEKKEIN